MNISYDSGRCGDGKTYEALRKAVANPAKYIIAVDKTVLFAERKADIRKLSGDVSVQVTTIDRRKTSAVVKAVEAIADHPAPHHIVIITHAALKLAKFDHRFNDWNLIIDEDFSTLTSDSWSLIASQSHFKNEFSLKPVGDFFQIVPTNFKVNDYIYDDAISQKVVDFRQLMDRQKVFTDQPEIGEKLTWWSVWDYRRLKAFKSVTILANAFEEKLSHSLAKRSGVTFTRIEREGSRVWSSRPVSISYFSETNGSMNFFRSEDGNEALEKIQGWQIDNHVGSEFWSANEALQMSLAGQHIKPMAAGRNDLMNCDTATFIYSAQASPSEVKALNLMTGGKLDGELIKRDREFEALSQFVLRGSLRQPDCDRPYSIRVYSKEQAEFVASFLTRNGYVDQADVSVEFIDVGIAVRQPKRNGRVARILTADEIAERQAHKRKQTAERVARLRERKRLEAAA